MRTLSKYLDFSLYALLCVGFLIFKLIEKQVDLSILWSGYFEDLIAIPIILKSSLLVVQLCSSRYNNFRIKNTDLAIIFIAFSLYFELALPYFDTRFTADLMDVFCYGIGAVFFSAFMNWPLRNRFQIPFLANT